MLTRENIVFIDTYLKNSEVNFADIRIEMVDHIASEIENVMQQGDKRTFYYIFKDYMVKNKKELLRQNTKFCRDSDINILKRIYKNIWSVFGVSVFLSISLLFVVLSKLLTKDLYIVILKHAPLALFFMVFSWYWLFIVSKKKRFSSLERISFYFMLLGQLLNVYLNTRLHKVIQTSYEFYTLQLFVFLITFCLVIIMQTCLQYKKYYSENYKFVGNES